jgi:uncharacterized SAM-dependent methyltransferase
MPTLLLYDAEGLRLFEEIMGLNEYYLTTAEAEVLTTHAGKIAGLLPENVQLLELGSGCVSSHSGSVTGINTQQYPFLQPSSVFDSILGIFARSRYC